MYFWNVCLFWYERFIREELTFSAFHLIFYAVLQEIEPSVGEKLCRLWLTSDGSNSDSASSRDSRRRSTSSLQHHVNSNPLFSTSIHHPFVAPFPHPSLGMFSRGGPTHIHLNPSLYPPPRLGSTSSYYRPPRTYQGPTKRYSAQHRARGSRTTSVDTTVP